MAMDEVVAVIETDKVSVDVRSPVEGVLVSLSVAVGDTVEVGAAMMSISHDSTASPVASSAVDAPMSKPVAPTTPIPVTSGYQPTISFRYGLNAAKQPSTSSSSAPAVSMWSRGPPSEAPFEDTPVQYRRKPISEQEIAAIDVCEDFLNDERFGIINHSLIAEWRCNFVLILIVFNLCIQ